jgi:flavin-dependent dehydrogenase
LQRLGWQTVLVERRVYPADKLCGEFLSGDGVACLKRMELEERLVESGARAIGQVLVSGVGGPCWQADLPVPGMGCSRRCLDSLLLDHCRSAGVEVVEGVRIRKVEGDWQRGFCAQGVKQGERVMYRGRVVIGAFGRRGGVFRSGDGDRRTEEGNSERGVNEERDGKGVKGSLRPRNEIEGGRKEKGLMALKVHVEERNFPPHVELHAFPGGYAGVCPVEGGRVNLCLLAEVEAFQRAGREGRRLAIEAMGQNARLAGRLGELRPEWEGALAAGGLEFGAGPVEQQGALLVGDAAGAISPLCGDGMSMALRAGELVAPLVDEFLGGRRRGEGLAMAYGEVWRKEFARRLRVGRILQGVLMRTEWTRRVLPLLRLVPALGRKAIGWSRGG